MGVLVGMTVIVGSRVGYEVGEPVGANDGSIVGPSSEQHVNERPRRWKESGGDEKRQ